MSEKPARAGHRSLESAQPDERGTTSPSRRHQGRRDSNISVVVFIPWYGGLHPLRRKHRSEAGNFLSLKGASLEGRLSRASAFMSTV